MHQALPPPPPWTDGQIPLKTLHSLLLRPSLVERYLQRGQNTAPLRLQSDCLLSDLTLQVLL